MFSFGRRDAENSPTHQVLNLSLGSPKNAEKNTRNNRRGRDQNQGAKGRRGNDRLHVQRTRMHDTTDGVEVSLDIAKGGGPASPLETREPPQVPYRPEPVLSLEDQLRPRQKVHKVQCSINFPASSSTGTTPSGSGQQGVFDFGRSPKSQAQPQWRPKDHRIPLKGMIPVEASYEDYLNLLQHSHVADEFSTVQLELEQMNREIEALTRDKAYLEEQQKKQSTSPTAVRSPTVQSNNGNVSLDWDIQKLLDSARLTDVERKRLESKRGNCLTIHFSAAKTREAFLAKTGAKTTVLLKTGNKTRELPPEDCLILGPHNCRPGGAATSLRQLSLMRDTGATVGVKGGQNQLGFFFSRDTGRSQSWGHLPKKLEHRLQVAREEDKENSCDLGDLLYLSTGSAGQYFVRFRSGETWWGSPANDDTEFHSILRTWDVYKVVFGPVTVVNDFDRGISRKLNSWIILGQDGRAAWKNIPHRLHQHLSSRLASWAAVADVSLGPGDSYFCRFLDGSTDYCLAASMASVCEYIERNGGLITEVALDPKGTSDYVIRHTDLR